MSVALSFDVASPGDRSLQAMRRTPVVVHCKSCRHEWAVAFAPMEISLLVRAMSAGRACAMCGSIESPMMGWAPGWDKPIADVWAWIFRGDTGTSSLTIWAHFMGRKPPDKVSEGDDPVTLGEPPGDQWDFARCAQLLRIAPATWRENLPTLAARLPRWKPFIDRWSELTGLFDEEWPQAVEGGPMPKLALLMAELTEPRPTMKAAAQTVAARAVARERKRQAEKED